MTTVLQLLMEYRQVIQKASADIDYIDQAPPEISRAIVSSYVDGIAYSHGTVLSIRC